MGNCACSGAAPPVSHSSTDGSAEPDSRGSPTSMVEVWLSAVEEPGRDADDALALTLVIPRGGDESFNTAGADDDGEDTPTANGKELASMSSGPFPTDVDSKADDSRGGSADTNIGGRRGFPAAAADQCVQALTAAVEATTAPAVAETTYRDPAAEMMATSEGVCPRCHTGYAVMRYCPVTGTRHAGPSAAIAIPAAIATITLA